MNNRITDARRWGAGYSFRIDGVRWRSHPLQRVYGNMKSRCKGYDPHRRRYYSDRGITVCDEWANSSLAFAAWAIDAGWQEGLQLDRIDNDAGYSPENCQFVDLPTNARNRRNNHKLSAFGECKTIAEWAEDKRCPVEANTLQQRVSAGWSPEDAIATRCRNNRGLAVKAWGESKTVRAWSQDERAAVSYSCLDNRLRGGWPAEAAIKTPAYEPIRG